jgi:PIN domain nuclease of toxin-antitoxin system
VKLLLDSHAFLWWIMDRPRLTDHAGDEISDRGNTVLISAATIWELEIKRASGRLEFDVDLPHEVARRSFTPLPVTSEHGVTAARLPPHHSDPFDRMLVAQAQIEGLTIVTSDRIISRYDVAVMPAAA